MKKLAALIALAGAAVVVVLALHGSSKSGYRVDAVFDDARGLVPGQLVEVAGARVGKIDGVKLTRGFKARVQMTVDRRFAPFKANATCSIRSQGLIAEHYVQCDPGTAAAKQLAASSAQAPTVPVGHTTEPVGLSDLFEIWAVPTRERLTVLLNELGLATVGRGQDLNAILRRANPALGQARRTLAILQRQRGDLGQAIDSTDAALRPLVRNAPAVPSLLRHSAALLARTRSRSRDLAGTVQRLPALLTQAQPALVALDQVASSGTPLLKQLGRSAPDIASLSVDASRLANTARPALKALTPVLKKGSGTFTRAKPLSDVLATYAQESLPSAKLAGKLWSNLRAQGFTDNLLQFFYNAAAATARYDGTSHILPAHIALNTCGLYATKPVKGCSANYTEHSTAPSVDSGSASQQQLGIQSVLNYLLK